MAGCIHAIGEASQSERGNAKCVSMVFCAMRPPGALCGGVMLPLT